MYLFPLVGQYPVNNHYPNTISVEIPMSQVFWHISLGGLGVRWPQDFQNLLDPGGPIGPQGTGRSLELIGNRERTSKIYPLYDQYDIR